MTARTVGSLTAADLGSTVRIGQAYPIVIAAVEHRDGETIVETASGATTVMPSATPCEVTP